MIVESSYSGSSALASGFAYGMWALSFCNRAIRSAGVCGRAAGSFAIMHATSLAVSEWIFRALGLERTSGGGLSVMTCASTCTGVSPWYGRSPLSSSKNTVPRL